MLRTILLGAGVFSALIAILIFSGKLPVGNTAQKATGEVVVWGTIDETQMNTIVQQFNAQAQTYRITYREVPDAQFSKKLTDALADGTGPDLIIAPHQQILANASRIYPFPAASLSQKAFTDLYVDGASLFYTQAGALALPITIDPLVLFYNRRMLSKHGIVNPPQYWDELVTMAPQLTLQNAQRIFVESAISLGAPNTPYSKDILMSTVMQLGQTPVLSQLRADGVYGQKVLANTPVKEGGEVLPLTTAARFFSQFADPSKPTYTWSQYQGNAVDQFLAEKLAMYIGYASEFSTLTSRNPTEEIGMTYLPQTKGYNTFALTGNMYGIAALKTTKNAVTALTVEGQFAGAVIGPQIALAANATPALRQYAANQSISDVIRRSMLVARPWYDSFPTESSNLTASLFIDILSGRLGPTDAVNGFVSRLQDLYTPY
jgi:ABC-type glycerol-3-phosphate transport system substrate-binding protein